MTDNAALGGDNAGDTDGGFGGGDPDFDPTPGPITPERLKGKWFAGKARVLEKELFVPRKRDEVFPFFSDAYNLEELTPKMLHFHVVTPKPIEMRSGTLIDYRLKVRGIPMRWRTRIALWEPPYRFIDEALVSPYRQWVHTHTFEEVEHQGKPGTLCKDRVEYVVPGGPLEPLIHGLAVKRDVEGIFKYREKVMAERFG